MSKKALRKQPVPPNSEASKVNQERSREHHARRSQHGRIWCVLSWASDPESNTRATEQPSQHGLSRGCFC
eukprot:874565-Prymnesium_polylepis.1